MHYIRIPVGIVNFVFPSLILHYVSGSLPFSFRQSDPDPFLKDVSRQHPQVPPPAAPPTPTEQGLRMQAAASSDEVLVRYLESFKSSVEVSLNCFSSKISELDQKLSLLSS